MSGPAGERRIARWGWVLAAGLYLAASSFAYRELIAEPFDRLPLPKRHEQEHLQLLYKADQGFVVGNMSRVARAFALDPSRLDDPGLCAPLSRPYTLGEHMFGEGLLGALPYLATRDPIFTFNTVIVVSTWISGLAMYALAFYWTRSASAALIAGLLFAFHPARLNNPAHVFTFGNAWSALALLAAHQLFTRRRWRDAALLALFLSLQLLESFYQVLALTIIGGTYGLFLLARNARFLLRLLPKLAAVGLAVGIIAWLVLSPYLDMQATWQVLRDRNHLLNLPAAYLPGDEASPGWIAFVLAIVGLLDRLRGPRERRGEDPRFAMALGGVLLFWCSVYAVYLPGLGTLTSPLVALGDVVPGLGAVRVPATLQFGVWLLFAFFAAYGVLVLVESRAGAWRVGVTVLLAAATLVETFHPTFSQASFGTVAGLEPYQARPSERRLAQFERLPPGAVLDLPLDFRKRKFRLMPVYLLEAGYHARPVAACYNSFVSPLQAEVQRLVQGLPDPNAARALSALGFRSIRVHHRLARTGSRRPLRILRNRELTEPIVKTRDASLFRLVEQPTTEDFEAIAGRRLGGFAQVEPPVGEIPFGFAARPGPVFRHPDPIEPSDLLLRWHDEAGRLVAETAGRGLLPPALAGGARMRRPVSTEVPVAEGVYEVDLVRPEQPGLVLSTRRVRVAQ